MLQIVSDGLEELNEEVVFVGGAVTELYADDPAFSDIRPTFDVDCVIELSSRLEYAKLEERLRAKLFAHDTSKLISHIHDCRTAKNHANQKDFPLIYILRKFVKTNR